MVWINFDLLRYESSFFGSDLDDSVRKVHEAAYSKLEEVYARHLKEIDTRYEQATEDDSREDIWQCRNYEDDRFTQQIYALTTMTLALLATRIESLIDAAKYYFIKTHPSGKNKHNGEGKLQRRVAEYRERFKLDMEAMPHFATVREVILARNCCIHRAGEPDEIYRRQTGQRLVDKYGRLSISADQLTQFTAELKSFGEALTKQLCDFRDNAKLGP